MHIHQIDLQYHAGLERGEFTLEDHVQHAWLSGRRVLGLTDHIELYFREKWAMSNPPYEQSLAGLLAYRQDMDTLQTKFPEMSLLFAPEIDPAFELNTIPQELIEVSDLFICETPLPGESVRKNTEAVTGHMAQIAQFAARTNRPAFVAHPFRIATGLRLIKGEMEQWVSELPPTPPEQITVDQVNTFFMIDVRALARQSIALELPLEINGSTLSLIRSSNLPAAQQMYFAAYRIMHAEGAGFVPGSDQHAFRKGTQRVGSYVPWEVFQYLGIGAKEITFLERLKISDL